MKGERRHLQSFDIPITIKQEKRNLQPHPSYHNRSYFYIYLLVDLKYTGIIFLSMKKQSSLSYLFLITCLFTYLNVSSAIYYSSSTASNPNSTANWFSNTNNTGTNPANFATVGDVFVIQAGHTYSTVGAWNVNGTVQVAGNLTIGTANSIGSLTIVTGGLVTGNAATTISAAGTFTIQDGGKYILNHTALNGATTFAGTEAFATSSNFEYQDMAANFVSGVSYGNFIYNIAGTRTFPAAITINGNFEMKQGILDFNTGRTIGGNFIQTGGEVTIENSTITDSMLIDGATAIARITQSTSTNVTATVGGDFEIKSGSFYINDGLQNVPGFASSLVVNGNFIINGGTFYWPTLSTSAVAGRVFVTKDVRFLSGDISGFLSTSTTTAGLYFEGPNEQTFTNTFTLSTGSLKDAFYYKLPAPATFFINEKYLGSSGQQVSVNGSFGTPRAGYARWPPATSTNIIRTFTINNPNGVLLRDSRNIKDTLYRTNGSITRDNSDGDVETISYSTGGTLEYNGTAAITSEDMEFPSSNGPTNLNINNPGSVTLHSSRSINGILIFSIDNGLLNTSSCNATTSGSAILTLNDGATVTGEGNRRFVNGTMTKIGNDAFTFPIGQFLGTTYKYAPIKISTPSSTGDSYSACYVGANPTTPGYTSTSKDASLTTPTNYQVSTCEYWHFNKAGSSTDVQLTLSWAYGRSCAFDDALTLVVANWLTTLWTNRFNDNTGTSPNSAGPGPSQTTGWVTSDNPITNYGTFTLAHPNMATTTLAQNRILLSGYADNRKHMLACSLEDCRGGVVEIEYSDNGHSFTKLTRIELNEQDLQRGLLNYTRNITANTPAFYRIKISKSVSDFYYTNTIRLTTQEALENLSIFPNPFTNVLLLTGNLEEISSIRVLNMMGQSMLLRQSISSNRFELQTDSWAKGIYYISVFYRDGRTESLKVVK